jgi:hypothetical protein
MRRDDPRFGDRSPSDDRVSEGLFENNRIMNFGFSGCVFAYLALTKFAFL